MPKAEVKTEFNVTPDELFAVITKYEDYPKFLEGCQSLTAERNHKGFVRAHYAVKLMGYELTYTLDHFEDKKAGKMNWKLVESNFLKDNVGSWELQALPGGKTGVHYTLALEFKIPVPSFLLNRAMKNNMLPSMVESFQTWIKKNG